MVELHSITETAPVAAEVVPAHSLSPTTPVVTAKQHSAIVTELLQYIDVVETMSEEAWKEHQVGAVALITFALGFVVGVLIF